MEFSKKVAYVREKLSLSQEKLANKLGVSFSTVNRWEKSRALPSFLAEEKFNHFCATHGIDFTNVRDS